VQLDGSFHRPWYETRGPGGCLMNLVNDATGRTLARLGDQETILGGGRCVAPVDRGVALYTDWNNDYVREPNAEEEVTGVVPLMQFGRMSADLDIQIIAASSPQANAYIESFNGRFHDECLNEHWFVSLADAQAQIEAWRIHYKAVRPHSSLDHQTTHSVSRVHGGRSPAEAGSPRGTLGLGRSGKRGAG